MTARERARIAAAAESETEPGAVQVLRNRRFLALWVAQLFTQVGANMVLFGLTVQVFALTGQVAEAHAGAFVDQLLDDVAADEPAATRDQKPLTR